MPKQSRERPKKQSALCNKDESVLFRVRLNNNEPWQFLCKQCQLKAKSEASYQYGGTWKQRKRN